jgi:unsaturated chondroitin disaccharide hydrolase
MSVFFTPRFVYPPIFACRAANHHYVMIIDEKLRPGDLARKLDRFWRLSAAKIKAIEQDYDPAKGAPVFTAEGRYTSRGWTEWTQGFHYGSAILQYDATGERDFLDSAREATAAKMSAHVAHFGVHDHGFNNVSTHGNLLRLALEGRIAAKEWERRFHALALQLSGAVQARRWTNIPSGGFIYSFNGPHSLFVDTIRSARALVLAHLLGQSFHGENDVVISLLERAMAHCLATARYSIYYGEGRDAYDVWGRTAHESVFNINDGAYRCPSTQQGYSPFSTWTRGLAWAMCGFAEQLECLAVAVADEELAPLGGRERLENAFLRAARATCDFYLENTAADGIPYWDTGAPGLARLSDYRARPADPYNEYEPVDSSAAAIAAQGLLRLGRYLEERGDNQGAVYRQAGLTVMNTLLDEPYLSVDPKHQGLILHSIYHRPNAWDHVPKGAVIPRGEASMWGDYHAREAALYLARVIQGQPYLTFWGEIKAWRSTW